MGDPGSTPNPTGAVNFVSLQDLSCTSSTACTAALADITPPEGRVTRGGKMEQYRVVHPVNAKSYRGIQQYAIFCLVLVSDSMHGCWGIQRLFGLCNACIENWNGTTWSIQPSSNPAGAESSSLTGVVHLGRPLASLSDGTRVKKILQFWRRDGTVQNGQFNQPLVRLVTSFLESRVRRRLLVLRSAEPAGDMRSRRPGMALNGQYIKSHSHGRGRQ